MAVANADLRVAVAGGTPLQMNKAADGLFVTPFIRGRQMRDVFIVTLRSQAGSGDAPVQIAYDVRLAELVPAGIKVCIVADRCFGDPNLYHMQAEELYFDFVIGFRR